MDNRSLKGNGTWHSDWFKLRNAQTTPMHNVKGTGGVLRILFTVGSGTRWHFLPENTVVNAVLEMAWDGALRLSHKH